MELQNNPKFGEIINEAKKFLAQGDRLILAQRAGVSRATISHYLNGKIGQPNSKIVNVIVELAAERRSELNSAKAKLFYP